MEHPLDVGTLPRLAVPTWQQRAMAEFWRRRQEEIEATVNFSERAIPMARLKKVICAEKGSMLMTFDMPAFLSKACELFVQELAIRAWFCAESHHRCTVLDSDIAEAIASTESYHFLLDVLYAKQHRSSISHHHHHPRPTRKRPRPAADQPSTHRRYPPHPHQIPQFPTPPMPTTIFHHMPLSSFPFPPREASATTVVTSTPIATGQCTALAGPVGGLLNIPNIYGVGDAAAACGAHGVGDAAGTSNAAAQQGDLTLPCPSNTPPFPYLRRSCPLPVANSNDPATAIATTVEFLPKGKGKGKGTAETSTIRASRTANSYGDNDVAAAAVGQQQPQQQQEEETSVDDHQNESAGAETIVAAGAHGDKYNIGEDGIEVLFDESLLDKFLEEIQIDEDHSLLSPDTTSADFLSFISTIPDMEEWIDDPYLLDDVFSDPSTSNK